VEGVMVSEAVSGLFKIYYSQEFSKSLIEIEYTNRNMTAVEPLHVNVHNSMINGWPDSVICGDGSHPGFIFFISEVLHDRVVYSNSQLQQNLRVEYNKDKTWKNEFTDIADKTAGCKNKTINTLISEKRAKFLLSSKESTNKNSILASRPDALTCGNPGVIFYAHEISTSGDSIYRAIDTTKDNYIKFNGDADGTFKERDANITYSDGCNGKSLKDLYNEGKAFN